MEPDNGSGIGPETGTSEINPAINSIEKAMGLIAQAGDSKSYSMEAIASAREGNLGHARECIEKAKRAMVEAHDMQTDMIREEVRGNHETVTLIMVHAQDHLTGALIMRDLAEEFVALYERLDAKS